MIQSLSPEHVVPYSKSTQSYALWSIGFYLLMFIPTALTLGKAPLDIAISGISVCFVLNAVVMNDWNWLKINWVPIALVTWIYYILISFQAIQPLTSLSAALPFGRFILFGVACQYWYLKDNTVQKHMITAIEFAVLFLTFNAWLQYFSGKDLLGIEPIGTRLTALSGKQVVGGYLVMMAWPVIIKWLMDVQNSNNSFQRRILIFFMVLAVFTLIPVTGERTSSLWLIMGLVMTYLLVPQTRIALFLITMPCFAILSIVMMFNADLAERMLVSTPNIIADTAKSSLNLNHEANNIYSKINQTALNLYLDKPLFGVGLKQFEIACQSAPSSINKVRDFYISTSGEQNKCNNSPQNMYLEFLVNTGTIGTILFLSLMSIWAWNIYQKKERISETIITQDKDNQYTITVRNNPIYIGVLIALCIRVFPFVTTTSFYFSWGGLTFWWMGCWLLAQLNNDNR